MQFMGEIMIDEEHLNTSWECEYCGYDNLTQKELRTHTVLQHPHSDPVESLFPQYAVCHCDEGASVYLLAESQLGPFYTTTESKSYVEEMPVYELRKHDWESVERDETPFSEYEK